MSEPIHIISLGAGVQSSTMSLMAACGEITPMPKCAIFADTQAEPASVYRWLDWLEKQLPFPVKRVSRGSLEDTCTRVYWSKKNKKITTSGIPAFLKTSEKAFRCSTCHARMLSDQEVCDECEAVGNPMVVETTGMAMMPRQCTKDFKIDPVTKAVNAERRSADGAKAILWIGISVDEVYRAKEHRNRPRIINRHPLLELKMRREDCFKWMKAHKFPNPPRSACVFCPYHHNSEWRRLKEQEPDEFARAVAFERKLSTTLRDTTLRDTTLRDTPFLHRSLIPLSEVDFSTEEERGQLNMFNNECEGMCGV